MCRVGSGRSWSRSAGRRSSSNSRCRALASHAISVPLRHLGIDANEVLETTFVLVNIAVITGFLVFLSYSKHLHIVMAPINVAASRQPVALGPLYSTPDLDMENVDE